MIPTAFLERLQKIVPPARFPAVEEALRGPKATSFRINTMLTGKAPVLQSLAASGIRPAQVPWYDHAFWVSHEARAALLDTTVYQTQNIYVQSQSSMVPPLVLAPQPGEKVLDLAAAPGSKTLQIACLMDRRGEIAAVDAVKNRFFKLRDNLSAQGADTVKTFLKDGRGVWRHRPEYFDRVLLDAPCSSEGRFHIDLPASYAYWSLRKVKEMARKQKRLLYSAIQCVRPGGVVVYATCSFAPEENEAVVHTMLKKFGDAIEVLPIDLKADCLTDPCLAWAGGAFNPQLQHARRILPGYHTEGFFVCKLRKRASTVG